MRTTTELRYQVFANAYVTNGFSGHAAAVAAGYSEKTADQTATKLLRIPQIQSLITELTQPVLDKYAITTERTLAHMAAIGYGDIGDVADWDGENLHVIPKKDLADQARWAVKKVTMEAKYHPRQGTELEYYDVKLTVEMHDKPAALRDLAKHQGILPSSGKIRINVDARKQSMNVLSLAGLSREDIMRMAGVEE